MIRNKILLRAVRQKNPRSLRPRGFCFALFILFKAQNGKADAAQNVFQDIEQAAYKRQQATEPLTGEVFIAVRIVQKWRYKAVKQSTL